MQLPCSEYSDTCSNVIYQSVDVGLSMNLTPDVKVGKIKVKCCSEPILACHQSKCDAGRFEIMITQTLSYKIPIEYSMDSTVSDSIAICDCDKKNCCKE